MLSDVMVLMMSSLTKVAFSFSNLLLWLPDHWMIFC